MQDIFSEILRDVSGFRVTVELENKRNGKIKVVKGRLSVERGQEDAVIHPDGEKAKPVKLNDWAIRRFH